jgi:hypothetical protein
MKAVTPTATERCLPGDIDFGVTDGTSQLSQRDNQLTRRGFHADLG